VQKWGDGKKPGEVPRRVRIKGGILHFTVQEVEHRKTKGKIGSSDSRKGRSCFEGINKDGGGEAKRSSRCGQNSGRGTKREKILLLKRG